MGLSTRMYPHMYMHVYIHDMCMWDLLLFTGRSLSHFDIYLTPHHIQPRVASSDSDSDGSDHIYDIPPNREDVLNKLITEGVSG